MLIINLTMTRVEEQKAVNELYDLLWDLHCLKHPATNTLEWAIHKLCAVDGLDNPIPAWQNEPE